MRSETSDEAVRSPFGETVRTARLAKGLTQEAVAEQLGMTQPAVSGWEKGITFPTADPLVRLAAILDLDVADLVRLIADEQRRDPEPVG